MFLIPSNCPKCGSRHINTKVAPGRMLTEEEAKDKYYCTECKATYGRDEEKQLQQVWSGCDNLIEEYKRLDENVSTRTGWKCNDFSEANPKNLDGVFDCRLCKNYKYNHHQAMTGETKRVYEGEVK